MRKSIAHYRPRLLAAASFAMLALTACERETAAPESRSIPLQPNRASTAAPITTPASLSGAHARYFSIAQQVPGFAGLSLDSSNTVATIYLSRQENEGAARDAAAAMLRDLLSANPRRFRGALPALRVQLTRFDFVELGNWRERIERMSDPDITSFGISEPINRIKVRVGDPAAIGRVTSRLESLGIPDSAFVVEIRGRVAFTSSLTDQFATPFGGLKIFNNGSCTLGFNAYDATGTPAFITASHCTNTMWYPDFGNIRQPNSTSTIIGSEWNDPSAIVGPSGSCPVHWRCRWSDAATIKYSAGVSPKWSYLALTSSNPTVLGYRPVIGQDTTPLFGEWVYTIGQVSGTRNTQIIAVNTTVSGISPVSPTDSIKVYGAVETNVGAQEGDSGGPVFLDTFASGTAYVAGIVFGADRKINPLVTYYSPLGNIERDLGNLTVFGTTVSVTGPTFINSPGTYTWTANALGSSGYTYQWQSSTDGITWVNTATGPAIAQTWVSVSGSIAFQFHIRVIATGSAGGYGQTGTSDQFNYTVQGPF
jgi:hypothetical protein